MRKFYNSPYNCNYNYEDTNIDLDISEINDYTLPKGLWYSFDEPINKYAYEIFIDDKITKITHPDATKICKIDSIDDVKIFCKKYCTHQKSDARVHNREYYGPTIWKKYDNEHSIEYFEPLNWKQIKKDFAGIEFNYFNPIEYDTTDICCYRTELLFIIIKKRCGCIWNINIVEKIKRIK
jgi:hypothetical protein